jgi:hydrogenase nickel incorporation protein HypB
MVKRVEILEDILGANDQIAAANRKILDEAQVFAVNIMASPGAGKTSLIEHTIRGLKDHFEIAVIDGDIASTLDADRAQAAGAMAIQINTGGECHLDAAMIQQALARIPLKDIDFIIVENVGNLICPAAFKLGVHKNILIASTPEGDDKPYKYPTMYRGVDALIINKIDLLPYLSFNLDYFRKGVELLNPGLVTFSLSCQTGQGIEDWLQWILDEAKNVFRDEKRI